MKRFSTLFALLFALTISTRAQTTGATNSANLASPGLKDAVILIIRHAEKPDSGNMLSEAGQKRAQAYVHYFQNFQIDGQPMKPDYIAVTADSKNSERPRLTLEPLGKALGLKLDNRFKSKNCEDLASDLRATPHGKCILIAWHHGEIPHLLDALGADSSKLLPDGEWPADTFNWLIELPYDHNGRLIAAKVKRINENLMPGDAKN